MKKAKPRVRAAAKKSKGGANAVDEYVAGIPEPARKNFDQLRAAIRSSVPRDATETISYKIPAIKHDRILVWFAAFASHCSLFPTAAVIEEFKNELKGYTTSKGTIQFSIDKPLPITLIKKLVKARVAHDKSRKEY